MRPYVKLLWPLVDIIIIIKIYDCCHTQRVKAQSLKAKRILFVIITLLHVGLLLLSATIEKFTPPAVPIWHQLRVRQNFVTDEDRANVNDSR